MGAGGGSGLTTSPVPPVVGGAETLLQVASPEVDLAARNSVPLVSTPLEVCFLHYACLFYFLLCIFYAF